MNVHGENAMNQGKDKNMVEKFKGIFQSSTLGLFLDDNECKVSR